ncbi:hypothetical protein [Xylanibacillus composti]|uniref:DUF4025 domain-containing protein n=1 Tax=Xylanibacillus composti TaxID=1572762 RepID=A0A8J4H4T1_9BACL|nr:hypothetical protein [Xylanibacillus composti]GIQ69496.1 hypothetical protein XYCOK13_23200 [Xylanibacillus composti]
MMADKRPDTKQPDQLEVEQANIQEVDLSTAHPDGEDTRVHSEELRYENADTLYE